MILHFEKLSSICSMLMYDGIGIMHLNKKSVHLKMFMGTWTLEGDPIVSYTTYLFM